MSCAIGFKSCTVIVASLVVSGPAIHALVMNPIVCGSSFFSERAAAATAPLPPGLLMTFLRTGTSFSFSIIVATARASRSLPAPGPVWTMTSTVLVGFQSANDGAAAATARASTAAIREIIRGSLVRIPACAGMTLRFAVDHLEPNRVELPEERHHEQQRRDGEQHARDRPE